MDGTTLPVGSAGGKLAASANYGDSALMPELVYIEGAVGIVARCGDATGEAGGVLDYRDG